MTRRSVPPWACAASYGSRARNRNDQNRQTSRRRCRDGPADQGDPRGLTARGPDRPASGARAAKRAHPPVFAPRPGEAKAFPKSFARPLPRLYSLLPADFSNWIAPANYKRLAASAALASAIAYPTWTGSWSAFPRSIDEFRHARITQAENSFFVKSNHRFSQSTLNEWRADMAPETTPSGSALRTRKSIFLFIYQYGALAVLTSRPYLIGK